VAACSGEPEGGAWLARLPNTLRDLERRWSLSLGTPFDMTEGSCSWVAPVLIAGVVPAVLKMALPHMEGEHEAEGLAFWDGEPTVRLLASGGPPRARALLLERCEPGTPLRALPGAEQDLEIARLLTRLWRPPAAGHPFRPLSAMIAHWCEETRAQAPHWPDAGLVRAGLEAFAELTRSVTANVLLATDLHAGNVLRAQRRPWLVIDPKPFVGDPAYDATQHLLNCAARVRAHPDTLERFADLAGVGRERVRLWTFARAAAEPREDWRHDPLGVLARAIAP
jgi:streptomycin 6-kinase